MDLPPPNLFKTEMAATSIARAPPMLTSPLPISSIGKLPNFLSASARILQLAARAKIAILVESETFALLIIRSPTDNIVSPTPTPSKLFPIWLSGSAPIFSIAPARIRTAVATNISETLALIRPFDPNPANVFVIDLIVILRRPSIPAIARRDLVI